MDDIIIIMDSDCNLDAIIFIHDNFIINQTVNEYSKRLSSNQYILFN